MKKLSLKYDIFGFTLLGVMRIIPSSGIVIVDGVIRVLLLTFGILYFVRAYKVQNDKNVTEVITPTQNKWVTLVLCGAAIYALVTLFVLIFYQ
ncbi:hypothetical protein AOC36_00885 [Erysipelothrix larvae]|uniref:Uncharacterized protein n=1 Tax=Erysipelothrix larvae TaxID=1514105 RepID=A0A109UGI6_9FIRM|nr:hypothetical protein [Erysipelothrix larvae]AMC92598.1 hypothetical protein AOC36_00885 [Erysipelothrix larvae]